jgi:hypothetical protein
MELSDTQKTCTGPLPRNMKRHPLLCKVCKYGTKHLHNHVNQSATLYATRSESNSAKSCPARPMLCYSSLGTQNAMHYLPQHRVLICRECQYAIQPSAISRHLKELHHIYHSNRQEFMTYAGGSDLADPKDVTAPKLDGDPVPGLTIIRGLACGVKQCGHLCATVKRMKMQKAPEHSTVTGDGLSGTQLFCRRSFAATS